MPKPTERSDERTLATISGLMQVFTHTQASQRENADGGGNGRKNMEASNEPDGLRNSTTRAKYGDTAHGFYRERGAVDSTIDAGSFLIVGFQKANWITELTET